MAMLMARSALESAAAREFLVSMPTVETLMPALEVSTLGPLALPTSLSSARRAEQGARAQKKRS